MKKAIIGKKVGMTQIFDESGKVIQKSMPSRGFSDAVAVERTTVSP